MNTPNDYRTNTLDGAEAYEMGRSAADAWYDEDEDREEDEEDEEEDESCGCSDPGCPCEGIKKGGV